MTTSFYNGVSGLKSFQNGIDIWAHNISNINTTAFKASIPEFESIFSKNISSNPISSDIGLGSILRSSAKDLKEGNLINTDKIFDLALSSEGWFRIQSAQDYLYTRDGRFKRDANGFLVNDRGDYLIVANANNLVKTDNGYIITNNEISDLMSNLSPIALPENVILPAVATSDVKIRANLNDTDKLEDIYPAKEDLYFSALYDKDGNFLNMVDGNSIAYTLGDIYYEDNLFKKEICINENSLNFDFYVNDKEIKLSFLKGSTKEEIINALANELKKNNILFDKTSNSIIIKSKDKLVIKSNDNIVTDALGEELIYKNNPVKTNEFNTMQSFANEIQSALNIVYPNMSFVDIENGKIVINNLSDKTINSKFFKTSDNNEAFFKNIYSLGNIILPYTAAKSYEFSANKRSFGGYIYEADGNKDTLSFEFYKKEVSSLGTIWQGNISVMKDKNVIFNKSFDFVFDTQGNLISPESITINNPQQITIATDLSAFKSVDNKISYSFSQNGVEKGYLTGYDINEKGDIFANFSNNKSIKVATIPIFHFANDEGLESIGDNLFKETSNSNKAFLYKDENGNYFPGSKVLSHMLETSNVNMATAMTELIITQKAFASAAKTITTSDEMIQKAINLKR